MAGFSKLVITKNGQSLIAKVLADNKKMEFTKISTSSKSYELEDLKKLNVLDEIKQTGSISHISRTNNTIVQVETSYDNTKLTDGYFLRTIGLFAKTQDEPEILYAVAIETGNGVYMPAYNGTTISGINLQLVTTVGNADKVTFEINMSAVATLSNVNELKEQINNIKILISGITKPKNTETTFNPDGTITVQTKKDGSTDSTNHIEFLQDGRITEHYQGTDDEYTKTTTFAGNKIYTTITR